MAKKVVTRIHKYIELNKYSTKNEHAYTNDQYWSKLTQVSFVFRLDWIALRIAALV